MAREGRAEQLVAVEFFHVVFVEQMGRALDELIEAEWRGGRPARTRQFGERAVHFPNEELGDCLVVPGADLLIKCKNSTNWNKMDIVSNQTSKLPHKPLLYSSGWTFEFRLCI